MEGSPKFEGVLRGFWAPPKSRVPPGFVRAPPAALAPPGGSEDSACAAPPAVFLRENSRGKTLGFPKNPGGFSIRFWGRPLTAPRAPRPCPAAAPRPPGAAPRPGAIPGASPAPAPGAAAPAPAPPPSGAWGGPKFRGTPLSPPRTPKPRGKSPKPPPNPQILGNPPPHLDPRISLLISQISPLNP